MYCTDRYAVTPPKTAGKEIGPEVFGLFGGAQLFLSSQLISTTVSKGEGFLAPLLDCNWIKPTNSTARTAVPNRNRPTVCIES